jgi:TatD DNase family protein
MVTQVASKLPEDIVAYELHGNCYINMSKHCTLRCSFCPKFNHTWQVQQYDLHLHQEPTVREIMNAVGDPKEYNEVVFCGLGEPTMRLDVLLRVAKKLKILGGNVRVNTDGLANLVHHGDVTPGFRGIIDTLSISMNAQNEKIYNQFCRPKSRHAYEAMLDFTRKATEHVPNVMVSVIDGLPGVDIKACKKIADKMGVGFKRRELDIVG